MTFRELKISGAYEYTPRQFGDDRGVFFEWFKASAFEATTGRSLELLQANCSVSAAGVLRGIHFTTNPPGQARGHVVVHASGPRFHPARTLPLQKIGERVPRRAVRIEKMLPVKVIRLHAPPRLATRPSSHRATRHYAGPCQGKGGD